MLQRFSRLGGVLVCTALAGSARTPNGSGSAIVLATDLSERAIPTSDFTVDGPTAFPGLLVRFEGSSVTAPMRAEDAVVELAGGERLVGPIAGGKDERFEVRLAGDLAVPADLERLHSLRFETRLAGAPAVEPAKEGDRIYRVQANGVERIDGAVEGFSEGGVRFHGELVGTIAIPWRSVGALFVEHLGSKPPRIDERALPVAVDLVDGSRIAGLFLGLKGGVIELNRRGTTLRIPVDAALQIGRDDGSIAFLANTAPASDEPSRPYGDDLGMVWRSRVDRNVSGGALVVGGARQARGLGVHAPSRTTWALDGSFSTLRGSVALDDEVLRLSARGSCVFRVLLDGREAFASPVVKAGDAPVAFTIPLGASKEVALVVDPTSDGFAGDRANWLGLLLARDQAAGASER